MAEAKPVIFHKINNIQQPVALLCILAPKQAHLAQFSPNPAKNRLAPSQLEEMP